MDSVPISAPKLRKDHQLIKGSRARLILLLAVISSEMSVYK
nr:hypothetical protein [Jeotgalibacillus proteolyticus]